MNITLKYGKSALSVDLPQKNIQDTLMLKPLDNLASEEDLLAEAFSHPIGTPLLREVVKKGEKIVIITSDITRPMPTRRVLPYVLLELRKAGAANEDVQIVFGLGSHRRQTEAEMRELVSDEIYESISCVDSNSGTYIPIGHTKINHTPVEVFENVLKADRRICLGNIEYHYFAGYSGGGKAIMPAVCSRASIQANHALMVQDSSKAGEIETNLLRQDIEEAAAMVGIDFLVNVVLDEKKQIVGAVCGHSIKAHREGIRILDRLYKIPITRKADIVLVSPGGYPKDINLYQAQKALDNAKHAVKDGGIIILAASCKEGLGEGVFERWMLNANGSHQLIDDIQANFELGGHKAAAIAMILEKCRIFLVSDLEADFVRKIFLKPFASLTEAVDEARKAMGDSCSVLVMPYGGSTLPYLV